MEDEEMTPASEEPTMEAPAEEVAPAEDEDAA